MRNHLNSLFLASLLLVPVATYAKTEETSSAVPFTERRISLIELQKFNHVSPDGTWAWWFPDLFGDLSIVNPHDPTHTKHDLGLEEKFSHLALISSDSQTLVAGRNDGGVSLFDKAGSLLFAFAACPQEKSVNALASNEKGDLLVLCGKDPFVYQWNMTNKDFGHWKQRYGSGENATPGTIAMAKPGDGMSIAFTKRDPFGDNEVEIMVQGFSRADGGYELAWTYKPDTSETDQGTSIPPKVAPGILYSPDGKNLLVYNKHAGGALLLLDAATGQVKREFAKQPSKPLVDFQFSPDGKKLIGVSDMKNEPKEATFDLSSLL